MRHPSAVSTAPGVADNLPHRSSARTLANPPNVALRSDWLTETTVAHLPPCLYDFGVRAPELGYVNLDELEPLAAKEGFEIEVDLQFDTNRALSQYAELAKVAGRIDVC
jgi:hypothetical protein